MNLQGRNLTQGLTGTDVAELQSELGKLGYTIPPSEQQGSQFGAGTLAAVEQFQTAHGLASTGIVETNTAGALTNAVAASSYTVTGTVSSPASAGVGALNVQLVDKNVGGDQTLASGQTKSDGTYAFNGVVISPTYLQAHGKTQPDLQVRVLSGTTLLATSVVQYDAPLTLILNVELPASATGLPSEYETLTSNLTAIYSGSLAALQESTTQQDITYLANKSGWDARAVAMAALAQQFGATTAPAPTPGAAPSGTAVTPRAATTAPPPTLSGAPAPAPAPTSTAPPPTVSLQPEFYYALFRAGVPANADALFQTGVGAVQAIWQKAIAQNVIPQSLSSSLATAAATFTTLSAAHVLTMAPSIGVSKLQDLLAPQLTTASQQEQFAQLLAQYRDDWTNFWPAVETAFGSTVSTKMQFLGQLYYLTVNNAPLVAALNKAESQNPLSAPLDLATRGYYDATKWTPLIGTSIPAGIPGSTPADQAGNYAAVLAAQVRVSFPTAVLGDQIKRGVVPIADTATVTNEVSTFLTANQAQFGIGTEPVEAFIARTKVAAPSAAALTQIKRLQRIYQMTADDSSMSVLLRHNLDSAYAITRYDTPGFVREFSAQLGGAGNATAIHLRAKQVFSAVLNIASTYANARISPGLGGPSAIYTGFKPPANGNAVVAAATLEELFGSLDYCNCSDCKSILSPAAYLVDLLHYIDQPSPTAGFSDPQTVLFGRRPDLQYLPLTCENTNTALPYIDIVNETLEYFVANNLSLQNYQGHDTGTTVTSAELLASPQYVNDAAYAALQTSFFPLPLPFNRPLELLRLQLQNLGVALPDAMIALRANDNITNNTTPTSYGWSDILIEQLGVSRDEYRLFTDSSLQLGDLYGIPKATGQTTAQWNATVLSALQTMSLQDLSRRTNVSYTDLVAMLQTAFINPNANLLPRVELLNAPFSTLQALHDNLNTPQTIAPEFIAALPAGLDATQYGGTTPTDYQAVVNWVTSVQVYSSIMSLVVIANPTNSPDDCSGAALQLRYSNPNNAQNLLSGTDFLKLIRFIRLWQKLLPLLNNADDTVTIAQTDAILSALYPAGQQPVQSSNAANDATNRPLLDAGFATALMRAGFLFQVMNRLSLTAEASLLQLLACWAPIGTVGASSLYQQMFLTPTLLQQDPGAQTATVSTAINTGDVLTTQINNVSIQHTVAAGETPAAAAAEIAAAINADTTVDQVSGAPLNKRFLASAQGDVVVIKAGFALTCAVGGGKTETYTAAASSPISQSATVGGTATPGDILTTTIDTVPIAYTVATGDSAATIAANIAAAINATTVAHPYSGLPLNDVIAASSTAGTITIVAANAGAPFALACSIVTPSGGTGVGAPVAGGYTATLGGTIKAGDVLTTTINGIAVPYTATASDTTTTALASEIANAINNAKQPDPTTGLPIGSLVHATSTNSAVAINAIDPATPFTLGTATSGSETYVATGPTPASQTVTVGNTIPIGSVLTTKINGLPLYYTAVAGDTPATIATNVAKLISTTTTPDLVTNLPLSSVVSAAASASMITVTATNPTTAFSLDVSLPVATYTAGRLSPPFADNGYGAFLSDPSQTLFGHEPTLCAACNLTGAEFALIAGALGYDASTPLTLGNVSALFRYGWLAHSLAISVLEFLRLREFSGLDPFAGLDPATAAPVEPAIVRFIRLLQAMSAASLQSVQALYLIWNQDISGTSAPTQADITTLASTLRADFAAVEAQFILQDDPDGSIAQGLMALVYGAMATNFFFGLLNNTFSVAVPYSYAAPSLPQPVLDASGGLLSYDDVNKQLAFAGVLSTATQNAIVAAATVNTTDSKDNVAAGSVTLTPGSMTNIVPGTALAIDSGGAQETVVVSAATATSFTVTASQAHNGTTTPFKVVNDPTFIAALANLAATDAQAIGPFFATYPELQPLYSTYAASTAPLQTKRTTLLNNFLPTLKRIRKEEQALASITSAVGSDPSFANALLQDPTILHADADPTAAAVTDLTAIESGGLSAQFFLSNNVAASADQTVDFVAPVSYAQTATIGGAVAAGVTLTTTINGNAIAYTTTAGDASPAILAGNVAAAVNACTTVDAKSGLPINRLVSATILPAGAGNAIAFAGLNPNAANSVFSLACAASTGTITYAAGTQLPANGGKPVAGVWSGFINAPQNGSYNFAVVADAGAAVSLQIDGEPVPMAMANGVWSNQTDVALVAGALVPFVLTVTSISTTLALSWQSPPGLGWELLPSQYLYPSTLVDRVGATYTRFLKATSIAGALSLVADEIAYLGTDTGSAVDTVCATAVAAGTVQFTPQSMANIAVGSVLVIDSGNAQETLTVTNIGATNFTAVAARSHDGTVTPFPIVSQAAPDIERGWLNFLSGRPDADPIKNPLPDLPTAARLGQVLVAVLDFSRMKMALSPKDERLLELLENPGATLPNGQTALLSLTGWDQGSINALLTQFFNSLSPVNLAGVESFRRVFDAYAIVQTCRIAASTLIAAVTNAPTATTVSALQSALRALYAESDWLTVVRPINDAMRIRQRDALVAYILQGFSNQPAPLNQIQTSDQLFEFFLIDPETQPPVESSRIRLALSTVQLFIERIVRNLEPQCSPADIDATQWQWMKRYRVWQANREVFLWPENWLYPELRDNQSELFQQMMSSLLQSDITDDAATSAYLDYLTGLEQVAKLEPCGIYYQPATAGTDETAYVIARTAGAHRKHYFRQLQYGSWTPWSEVKIDCEDMPITPIVWNDRLFLFWLRVLKSSAPASPPDLSAQSDSNLSQNTVSNLQLSDMQNFATVSGQAQSRGSVPVQAVLCWSEFYNGKWQTTKTSDINHPTYIGTFDLNGANAFDPGRNLLTIFPIQIQNDPTAEPPLSIPDGVLILAIGSPLYPIAVESSFVLFNTHSLPIILGDIPLDQPFSDEVVPSGTYRSLGPLPASPYTGANATGTLSTSYSSNTSGNTPINVNVLDFNLAPRFIDSQPGLPNAWTAPFFFEDRRNLFYVTTSEDYHSLPIVNWFGAGFGTVVTKATSGLTISGINFTQLTPPLGTVKVSPIRITLGSGLPISYQGQRIGVTGINLAKGLITHLGGS